MKPAATAPPTADKHPPGVFAAAVAVVVIETVALVVVVPEIASETGTLHCGKSCAPAGPLTVQFKLTVPENPFAGTMVNVVLPLPPDEISIPVPPLGTKLTPGPAEIIMLCSRADNAGSALPFQVVFSTP